MDSRDILHQIEYRWHDQWDLSPIASTLQESLAGWDSWIRPWVRHPHVEGLRESACYQVDHATGRAALAWRFEDPKAADREDGTKGRPLVSRVIAGHADQLTPELALVLCRVGLPTAAGPLPCHVTAETVLPEIDVRNLMVAARKEFAGLDEEAAGQQECLLQVLPVLLSESRTPVAIHLPQSRILEPPAGGLPCSLMWGLYRIARPVLGRVGRGWSFSTFELPLGAVQPSTLPDIVFRQSQSMLTPPAIPRTELKVYPFEPGRQYGSDRRWSRLASWLFAEYEKQGGDDLSNRVAAWCDGEPAADRRAGIVYAKLRSTRPAEPEPVPAATDQAVPPASGSVAPDKAVPDEAIPSEPVRRQPATGVGIARDAARRVVRPDDPTIISFVDSVNNGGAIAAGGAQPDEDREGVARPRSGHSPTGSAWPIRLPWHAGLGPPVIERTHVIYRPRPQRDETAGQLASRQAAIRAFDERGSAEKQDSPEPAPGPVELPALLRLLPEAKDLSTAANIRSAIKQSAAVSGINDRVRARREISGDDWHRRVSALYGNDDEILIEILVEIYDDVVIRDLGDADALRKIAEWARQAAPLVIEGLLEAARRTGDENWRLMARTIQPALGHRRILGGQLRQSWPTDLAVHPAPDASKGGGFFGWFKKA